MDREGGDGEAMDLRTALVGGVKPWGAGSWGWLRTARWKCGGRKLSKNDERVPKTQGSQTDDGECGFRGSGEGLGSGKTRPKLKAGGHQLQRVAGDQDKPEGLM